MLHTERFSLKCKQHSKTRKEHVQIKPIFNKAITISLYCKDMVEPVHQRRSETAVRRCFTK